MKIAAIRILMAGAMMLPLALPSSLLAVGAGGGGGTTSCTSDTWSCTSWSTCSTAGRQTRTCTLTYDCPTASTPSPATEQSCTPPPTNTNIGPANQNSSATTNTGITSTNSSITNTSSCTADTWQCGNWSTRCDINGLQERACSLTADCPAAATQPPAINQPCDHLQCGNLSTLRERIFCRLNLSPGGVARELALEYLPEECRVMTDTAARAECIAYYQAYAPCWNAPAGPTRFACARNVLKLGPVVADEVKNCRGKTGLNQVACKVEVREKIYDFIKFRLYDLEERAERFGERGAGLEAIADLETIVEMKKRAFNAAQTKDERRQIILDVRQAWQTFINRVRSQIK